MTKREKKLCKECRRPAKTGGLCGYHEVKAQWGPKWAALCHPQHPDACK